MDQIKIGKFIASCRKEKNLTQAALAEKLGITDRAVSKWENAKSMPDTGIMPEVCQILGISVNELLSGEKLDVMEDYRKNAEENLLALKKLEEQKNRMLLQLEWVIGYMGTIPFFVLIFTVGFGTMSAAVRYILITLAAALFITSLCFALKLEQSAGYYECQNCHERYIPTLSQVIWAPHKGRKRYMKCPKCGKRTYQHKVLTKD